MSSPALTTKPVDGCDLCQGKRNERLHTLYDAIPLWGIPLILQGCQCGTGGLRNVLTGGPSEDNSTLMRELCTEDPPAERWLVVPEGALPSRKSPGDARAGAGDQLSSWKGRERTPATCPDHRR